MIVKEQCSRRVEEIKLSDEMENKLNHSKGDIINVKLTDNKDVWWITVVYMGVEGRENLDNNRKLYEALLETKEKVGREKWVIMGDFNGHVGQLNEKANANGQMLLDFIESTGYIMKNWELENPVTWRSNGHESAIDYIIVNNEVSKLEISTWKNEDIDISDHFMIGITCRRSKRKNNVQKEVWREKWNLKKGNWIKYCEEVDQTMNNGMEWMDLSIDQLEKKIKNSMKEAANRNIGKQKFKNGKTKLKGWWDDEVKAAIAERKKLNRKQRYLAKETTPKVKSGESEWQEAWKQYQVAKKTAQDIIRKKISKWEEEQAKIISRLPRGEREKEGWKRLRRNIGGENLTQEVKLTVKGIESSDEKVIVQEVQDFWRKVIWKNYMTYEKVKIFSDRKSMRNIEIESQDIDNAVKALKIGKSAGTDGVVGEFIKYGGNSLKVYLQKLFQKIIDTREVPQDWQRSRVTLLFKGGGKPRQEIGSYRPIAVMNMLAKVFGWIINRKLVTWAEENKVLGEEQSGFRKGRGGLENVLVIKEIMERNMKCGEELYLTFLDIEKAYDTVDRRKLMELLAHLGVEENIVRVLKNLYTDNMVKFTLGNNTTKWMKNNVGVRQGCIISPTLFNFYIEELIVRIRNSGYGVRVGDKKLGCLAYADDLVLMAESKEEMEELLKIADNYGKEWNLKYSARKCKVMEVNSKEEGQWVLGNNILEVVDKYNYLGLEIYQDGVGGEKQRKISEEKARKMTGMIINSGLRSVNRYEVGRSLWKAMAVPYCLYGSEITQYREGDISQLEKIQNIIGRWSLGVPASTAVEAIRGEMGWSSFKERIEKGKFNFMKKIEGLAEDRWVKKILAERNDMSRWRKEVERWKKKENLQEEWCRVGVKEVKKKVEENGRERWKQGMENKNTLRWYKRKEKPEAIHWHTGDWGSRLLVKARTGTLEVKARKRNEDQNCSFCAGQRETVEHLIVECVKYEGYRKDLINVIVSVIGEEEWNRRLNEDDGGISTALGLYETNAHEKIIEAMKWFLKKSWEMRQVELGI